MPKSVELTIQIEVQKVSCPGVWLCQDGRVSLTVFALETSYQTCSLPPVFPLIFKDVFYFRKRFEEGCALHNICCLLKDETIYCELVQWSDDCMSGECVMLAQYLGSLNDILFPPNMCSSDGVDLLMRRTKDFPGILSPKIEITSKVRLDEIRIPDYVSSSTKDKHIKKVGLHGTRQDFESARQKQVCHSPQYHKSRCTKSKGVSSRSRSRSSRSYVSKSNCSLNQPTNQEDDLISCLCPHPHPKSRARSARYSVRPREYSVYSVDARSQEPATARCYDEQNYCMKETEDTTRISSKRLDKMILESRYIDVDRHKVDEPRKKYIPKVTPCICEICKKYHEIFHINTDS